MPGIGGSRPGSLELAGRRPSSTGEVSGGHRRTGTRHGVSGNGGSGPGSLELAGRRPPSTGEGFGGRRLAGTRHGFAGKGASRPGSLELAGRRPSSTGEGSGGRRRTSRSGEGGSPWDQAAAEVEVGRSTLSAGPGGGRGRVPAFSARKTAFGFSKERCLFFKKCYGWV